MATQCMSRRAGAQNECHAARRQDRKVQPRSRTIHEVLSDLLLRALKRTTLSQLWISSRCSGLKGPFPTTAMLRVLGRVRKPHSASALPRTSGACRMAVRSHRAELLDGLEHTVTVMVLRIRQPQHDVILDGAMLKVYNCRLAGSRCGAASSGRRVIIPSMQRSLACSI